MLFRLGFEATENNLPGSKKAEVDLMRPQRQLLLTFVEGRYIRR